MTDAADAITAGDTTRRVPPGPPGTEAARLGEALNAMIDTNAATAAADAALRRRRVARAAHPADHPAGVRRAAQRTGRPRRRARWVHDHGCRRARCGAGRRQGWARWPRWPRWPSRWPRWPTRCAGSATRRPGCGGSSTGCSTWPGSTTSASWPGDPVDLGRLVRDVASDLRVVAPDRVVTVDAPESLVVTGDRDRLTQALVGPDLERRAAHPGGHPGVAVGRRAAGRGAGRRRRRGARHPARAPAARLRAVPPGRPGAVVVERRHRARAGHRRRHRPGARRLGERGVAARARLDLLDHPPRDREAGATGCGRHAGNVRRTAYGWWFRNRAGRPGGRVVEVAWWHGCSPSTASPTSPTASSTRSAAR